MLNLQNTYHNHMKFIIEAFLAFALSLVVPVLPFLQAVFVIVLCDFLIGITAALYSGERFSWKKLCLIGAKMVAFGSLIVAVFQIQKLLEITQPNIAGLVASVICLMELKSIDKNIEKLFGFSIWKFLMSKVSSLKELDESISHAESNKDNNTP
jgi:peptidoglycan/LPS O-acetylase OafA/YrhL